MLGRDALAPTTIVPAAMPIPICLGVSPDGLWLEAFQTDQDIRAYWRRGARRFADHRACGNSPAALT